MTATIVFDFDGTLALGRGPAIAYAQNLADATGAASLVDQAMTEIESFESGDSPHLDAYDAVGAVAAAHGIADAVRGAAYAASRELLGTDLAPVFPPPGLSDFVARVSRRARLVLATNAPGAGIDRTLKAWGVAPHFHATHFSVGKPGGLVAILREALAAGRVLAVGDIIEFDLAPAMALGADTALVGATAGRAADIVTLRGDSLADLYADIETWTAAADSSTPVPAGTTVPLERHN